MYNIPPTALKLPDGQAEHSPFHGVLRQPFSDSTTGVYARQKQVNAFMAQTKSNVANHVARVPLDQRSNQKAVQGRKTSQTYECPDRLNGRELQNRRRLGEDRISCGGWKPEIAELAIEYIQQGAWYERASKIWGVRCFVREAEGLGELCQDSEAIRRFLNRNIHKFIAFHAMSKDFEVPDYLVRKADQRRGDWVLKYPWLRSFIREYQGRARSTAESLVQAYKDQGDGIAANDHTIQAIDVGQGEDSGKKATPVPDAAGMSASCGHEDIETCCATPDRSVYSRKRQRGPDRTDDLETDDLIKRVKRESTEDEVIRSRDRTQEAGTCEVDMGDGNECKANECEWDEGKGMIHAKGRSLTVLFHGMRSHGGQESDHVQVYVPRTSKGVTINFL
ncbi:hypothetical protein LA080_008837 [Diaporthe eres]|uniref:Uncharacterized protein n=1 Tax=Diaporthe vaccinii TaxID=105482 RepID=A0ABR4E587_9PEZI|nr:hypothetical protein LA080_008837 [Diaporthe eres]